MTPNDYITKAIHAIKTDQPNLAMLYMKRGYAEMKRLRSDPWRDVQDAVNLFAEAMTEVGKAYATLGQAMFEALSPVMKTYANGYRGLQADYALVPSGCCDDSMGDCCTCSCHDWKGSL